MKQSRMHLTIVLALLARSATAAGPGPLVEVIDDFDDGDAVGWTGLDLLADAFGPSTYEVVDGRYQITTVPLPALPLLVAEAAAWDGSIAPSYSNGILRATIRFNNDDTNAAIAVRADPKTPNASYAFFVNNHEDAIGIADSAQGAGNLSFVEMNILEDVDYVVQATFMGTHLSISVWRADGEGEVATVCLSDGRYTQGVFALAVYNQPTFAGGTGGALSAQFDDITFVPGPDLCETTCSSDITGDRLVGFADLLELLSSWGPCPD